MKIKTNKTALLKALQTASKATSKFMPLYENLLLTADGKTANIYGTDASSGGVQMSIDCEVIEAGKCLLPQSLIQVVSKCGELITLSCSGTKITLSSGKYRYSCVAEDASDFILPELPPKMETFKGLGAAIADCIPFASTDENRQAMCGVHINFKDCEAVATDAHRLMVSEFDALPFEMPENATIRANYAKLMTDCDTFAFTANKVFHQCGGLLVWASLIEEKFPNYKNVIPTTGEIVGQVPQGLAEAVARVGSATNAATNLIKFAIEGDKIVLSGENIDFSTEGTEDLDADFSGALEIGFSSRFVEAIIKVMPNASMHLSTPEKPCVFKEGSKTALLMPVMLTSYVPKY